MQNQHVRYLAWQRVRLLCRSQSLSWGLREFFCWQRFRRLLRYACKRVVFVLFLCCVVLYLIFVRVFVLSVWVSVLLVFCISFCGYFCFYLFRGYSFRRSISRPPPTPQDCFVGLAIHEMLFFASLCSSKTPGCYGYSRDSSAFLLSRFKIPSPGSYLVRPVPGTSSLFVVVYSNAPLYTT